MPTNNFKLFDENKTNILTDAEYAANTQRQNGVQTGVASSKLNNKFSYQTSLVAYAIAQIMNANGQNASDSDAVATFVANLQGSIVQKVVDCATSAEAAAGVITNKYITPATMKAAALLLSGGTLTGPLYLSRNPIDPLEAATKQYVDESTGENNILYGFTKVISNKGNGTWLLDRPITAKSFVQEILLVLNSFEYYRLSTYINFQFRSGDTNLVTFQLGLNSSTLPSSGTLIGPIYFNMPCAYGIRKVGQDDIRMGIMLEQKTDSSFSPSWFYINLTPTVHLDTLYIDSWDRSEIVDVSMYCKFGTNN